MAPTKPAAPAPAAPTFAITLTAEAAGGRRAVGDYLPGREYRVPAAEALRLIARGFLPVGATVDDIKAAAPATTAED